MPYIPAAGELKTKPTQHSVKELRSIGIAPDILLIRADREIPKSERRKLSLFCNVRASAVIQALDVETIYDVPMAYHKEGLDSEVLAAFGIILPRNRGWSAGMKSAMIQQDATRRNLIANKRKLRRSRSTFESRLVCQNVAFVAGTTRPYLHLCI